MNKFNKKYIIIPIVIMMVASLFFILKQNNEKDSNGVLWNGKQTIEKRHEQSSISIPCFNEISFSSGTTEQKVNLYNPESNGCSMNYRITLPDETVIWEEENIQPGYGVYDIQINEKLEKGTYEGCVFAVRCYRDGVELNGCNITFTLNVN